MSERSEGFLEERFPEVRIISAKGLMCLEKRLEIRVASEIPEQEGEQ